MTAAFQDFKARFDDYLRAAPEYPAEMYFLRYEAAHQLRPLPSDPHDNVPHDQALAEHWQILDECQDYAVSREVTSTYVLFNVDNYTKWLEHNHLEDSRLNRAQWAREQIVKSVTLHPTEQVTWFVVTDNASWFEDMLKEEKHATVR